jgi:hypothetical protein
MATLMLSGMAEAWNYRVGSDCLKKHILKSQWPVIFQRQQSVRHTAGVWMRHRPSCNSRPHAAWREWRNVRDEHICQWHFKLTRKWEVWRPSQFRAFFSVSFTVSFLNVQLWYVLPWRVSPNTTAFNLTTLITKAKLSKNVSCSTLLISDNAMEQDSES